MKKDNRKNAMTSEHFIAVLLITLNFTGVPDVIAAADSNAMASVVIDANYPGGNMLAYNLRGQIVFDDTVYLRQDLRDTEWWWFYWNFRVRGAEGKTLNFKFCLSHPKSGISPFGTQGPAVSIDNGDTWSWLGFDAVKDDVFTYTFAPDAKEVRFCFTIPYQQSELSKFIVRHKQNPNFSVKRLCETRKGRAVQQLYVGKIKGEPKYRILLTARHHACESIASYVLEGVLKAVLADTGDGLWLRDNVEILAVPFMDKDGVEDGDQGKLRVPHDHNMDYQGQSIYPTVANLRQLVPDWSKNKLRIAIDLHCPYIDTPFIYFLDPPTEACRRFNKKFRDILSDVQAGPLIFKDDEHRTLGDDYRSKMLGWASGLPDIEVATTIEIPYGIAGDTIVTAESARLFGHDLAVTIKEYLNMEDNMEKKKDYSSQ